MSIRALCIGVRDHLRNSLGDAGGKWIDFQPSGDPPPTMPDRYITVKYGGYTWAGREGGDGDDRYYSVIVAAFWKLAYAPTDRRGQMLLEEGRAYLLDLSDQIDGFLVNNWTVMNLANAKIIDFGVATNGFCECFKSSPFGSEIQGYMPVWADPESPPTILKIEMRFPGARRIRVDGTVV